MVDTVRRVQNDYQQTSLGQGIPCTSLGKGLADGAGAVTAIEEGMVDLVINIPREYDQEGRPDGYWIRRRAVDAGIPLLTDLQLARAVIEALRHKRAEQLSTLTYDEYLSRNDHHAKPLG